MSVTIDFVELGRQYGARLIEIPLPNGAVHIETEWDVEPGRAVIDRCLALAEGQTAVQFNGHTHPWVMLAVLYQLRRLELSTYFAVFDRSVPIEAYAVGGTPEPDQPVRFEVEEQGDDVLLSLCLGREALPFEVPFSAMRLPQLPAGKNLFVQVKDAKLFHLFGVPAALGENCRTLNVVMNGGLCRCAISHAEGVRVGDEAANPFARHS